MKVKGWSRSGLAGREPGTSLGLREASGSPPPRWHQPREWLGEGAAAAGTMAAAEASNAKAQRHRLIETPQIGRLAFVAAADRRAGRTADRAATMQAPRMGGEFIVSVDDVSDGVARKR